MSEEVTHIFARLQGPACDEASSVAVLADLRKAVWLEPLTDDQKWLSLHLILNTLVTGRVNHRVIAKLNVMLKQKLALLPIHYHTVLQNVNFWCQQKLL